MKALVGAFNQEKALVGAFSVIVQPVVEPMEHYTALDLTNSVSSDKRGASAATSRGDELSRTAESGAACWLQRCEMLLSRAKTMSL